MLGKRILLVISSVLLAACQVEPVRDEQSPRSRLSVASAITLHQELPVPAGHSRVFLQFGEVVAKVKLDQYQPHCNFEVRAVSRGEGRLLPDTFTVTKVMEDEEEVVLGPTPLRRAALRYSSDDMATMVVTRFVRHTLYSASQPQVVRLTCHGGFDEPWQVKTPSVSEIRRALGDIATVRLVSAI